MVDGVVMIAFVVVELRASVCCLLSTFTLSVGDAHLVVSYSVAEHVTICVDYMPL